MTLGGLALAVGILVDQSIVVIENTTRHLRMGKAPMEAALDGAREVFMPVLVSTLTFVLVFFPILYLTGIAKFLFTPLAMSAGFAIVASFLVAMTLLPALSARILKVPAGSATEQERAPAFGRLLRGVVALRIPIVLGAAVIFAGSLLLLSRGGYELFSKVDARQFTMFVRMPSGTRIEETERIIKSVEDVIVGDLGKPDPEFPKAEAHPKSQLKLLISNIGVLMDWPAAYTPNTGPMDAFVLVQLKDKAGESVFRVVERLRKKLTARYPDVEFSFDTGGMLTAALNFGEPAPIHFQARVHQFDAAQEVGTLIRDELPNCGSPAR